MAQLNFDTTGKERLGDFTPIPAGEYKAVITESDFVRTKAGTGQYLKLKYEIIEGEHKGRVLFTNLNLMNPNQTAVDIAQRELASICDAVKKPAVSDSSELHNVPHWIKVVVKDGGQYGPQNEIKGYKAIGQAVEAPAAATATAAPVADSTAKPWERG